MTFLGEQDLVEPRFSLPPAVTRSESQGSSGWSLAPGHSIHVPKEPSLTAPPHLPVLVTSRPLISECFREKSPRHISGTVTSHLHTSPSAHWLCGRENRDIRAI